MRRIVAALAIVLGIGMVLAPAPLHLFSRTSAAEHLTDDIRPAMTDQALAQTRSEFDTQRAALQEFVDRGIPRLAADTGQTTGQFRASIASQYPAVAPAGATVPSNCARATADGDVSSSPATAALPSGRTARAAA